MPDTENLLAISNLYGISLDELVLLASKNNAEKFVKSEEKSLTNTSISKNKQTAIHILKTTPYPILILIPFLLWGFIWDGWTVAWTLFLTIPIYYSIIKCLKTNSLKYFNYPVLLAFIYLLLGMQWGWWHPHWILFLTLPVYYAIIKCIKYLK